jgi:hypothetical protein
VLGAQFACEHSRGPSRRPSGPQAAYGAHTAVVGLMLMHVAFILIPASQRTRFVAQIISTSHAAGYSQQLSTRFVHQSAQRVLENFGRTRAQQEAAHEELGPGAHPS